MQAASSEWALVSNSSFCYKIQPLLTFIGGWMRRNSLIVIIIMLSLSGCASGGQPTAEQLANNTFAECPSDYEQMIKQRLSANLIAPSSVMFRFSRPEKYVHSGQYGHVVSVGLNAKNRFGGYIGEQLHEFMCFPNGSVREINETENGMKSGFHQAGY